MEIVICLICLNVITLIITLLVVKHHHIEVDRWTAERSELLDRVMAGTQKFEDFHTARMHKREIEIQADPEIQKKVKEEHDEEQRIIDDTFGGDTGV